MTTNDVNVFSVSSLDDYLSLFRGFLLGGDVTIFVQKLYQVLFHFATCILSFLILLLSTSLSDFTLFHSSSGFLNWFSLLKLLLTS